MTRLVATAAMVAALLALGCASKDDVTAKSATPAGGALLPTGFPEEFPTPEGVLIDDSLDGEDFDKLFLVSEEDPSTVLDRYRSALAAAGWQLVDESKAAGVPAGMTDATLVSFEGFGREGTIIVGSGESVTTLINVTFVAEGAG